MTIQSTTPSPIQSLSIQPAAKHSKPQASPTATTDTVQISSAAQATLAQLEADSPTQLLQAAQSGNVQAQELLAQKQAQES